jgi:hypothetical protein
MGNDYYCEAGIGSVEVTTGRETPCEILCVLKNKWRKIIPSGFTGIPTLFKYIRNA